MLNTLLVRVHDICADSQNTLRCIFVLSVDGPRQPPYRSRTNRYLPCSTKHVKPSKASDECEACKLY
jgi:hypothetical protein